jgi:hypothetical protein
MGRPWHEWIYQHLGIIAWPRKSLVGDIEVMSSVSASSFLLILSQEQTPAI